MTAVLLREHDGRVVSRGFYDFLYRRGAPWEGPPRQELVRLVEFGEFGESGRAIDLGCGTGANAVFLAEHGFAVTGVDFSPVALAKAARAAEAAGVEVVFVDADLTELPVSGIVGQFDLAVDYGTLDDLRASRRCEMARTIAALVRPGGAFLLWCFYGEIPWWRRSGARFPGGLRLAEPQRLFGADFAITRLAEPAVGSGFACFLMRRRANCPRSGVRSPAAGVRRAHGTRVRPGRAGSLPISVPITAGSTTQLARADTADRLGGAGMARTSSTAQPQVGSALTPGHMSAAGTGTSHLGGS